MAPPEPIITPAPDAYELLKRQNNGAFIGYLSINGSYTYDQCSSPGTFYDGPTVVGCCLQSVSCNLPIQCAAGTLTWTYPPFGTITTSYTSKALCTDQFSDPAASLCNTAKVYENVGDNNPKSIIYCAAVPAQPSLYRAIPTSNVVIASTIATALPSSVISIPTQTATGLGPIPSPQKSNAWIAGAVVGPIVGIALIGALIFFLLRERNKKKRETTTQSGTAAMAPAHPSQPPPGIAGYADTKGHYANQPDAYGQGGYNPHHSYGAEPVSPVPQYSAAPPHFGSNSPLPSPGLPHPSPGLSQHSPGPQYSPPPQHSQLHQQGYPPNTMAAHTATELG